jgi:hypothetical protein
MFKVNDNYLIKQHNFIFEMDTNVLCAAETEILYITSINFGLQKSSSLCKLIYYTQTAQQISLNHIQETTPTRFGYFL